jgi:hypothetical protein
MSGTRVAPLARDGRCTASRSWSRRSTLNAYLQAIGGTARMIVSFSDGHETTLDLSQLA